MKRRDREALVGIVEQATGGRVVHFNDGGSHRRMLLWNRRFERSQRISRRNQPPKGK